MVIACAVLTRPHGVLGAAHQRHCLPVECQAAVLL